MSPAAVDAPTVTHQLRFADYLRIDAQNISGLVEIAVSPKRYKHRLTHAKKDTGAFRIGRAGHTLTLQPELFPAEYAIRPDEFPDQKGEMKPASLKLNSCKEWHEVQERLDMTILTPKDHATAVELRDAIEADETAMDYLTGGHSELTLQWIDGPTGIACKGRIDKLVPNRWIVDIKSTRDPVIRRFQQQAADLHYHTKLAWYRDAADACGFGQLPVYLIVVGSEDEHDVVVYEVPDEALEAGSIRYSEYMDRLAECRATNRWPGVSDGNVIRLKLPQYAIPAEMRA